MYKESDKRSAVYAVSVMSLSEANVNNIPGVSTIRVQGVWDKLQSSEISFTEKEVADGYEVDLKIKVTNTSIEKQQELNALSSIYVVCRLHTTNCMDRVIGTEQCPVTFTLNREGSPSLFILHYKGIQPEMAKLLQSF